MITNSFLKRYESLGCVCSGKMIARDSLRVNTLKISTDELIKRLEKKKVTLRKIPFLKNGFTFEAKFSLGATPEYLQGYYYLQESASQLPAEILDPKPGESILDMAASPGSKTTQMAQMMNNEGTIVALDINFNRLSALRNNIERCGVQNVIIYKKDARFVSDLGIMFDKILLDAPCSGNYAIEKDFFLKKTLEGVMERSRTQKELLKAAVKVLKKGGLLVYSTCSLEPEENELNVDWLLKKYPELKLEDTGLSIGDPGITNIFAAKLNSDIAKCRRLWPDKTGTEGFFIAKIRKK